MRIFLWKKYKEKKSVGKLSQLKRARRSPSLKSDKPALLECEDSSGFPYFRVRISASREFLSSTCRGAVAVVGEGARYGGAGRRCEKDGGRRIDGVGGGAHGLWKYGDSKYIRNSPG